MDLATIINETIHTNGCTLQQWTQRNRTPKKMDSASMELAIMYSANMDTSTMHPRQFIPQQ
jgi:hypothetical protein